MVAHSQLELPQRWEITISVVCIWETNYTKTGWKKKKSLFTNESLDWQFRLSSIGIAPLCYTWCQLNSLTHLAPAAGIFPHFNLPRDHPKLFMWWGKLLNTKPQCTGTFSSSAAITFANVPLVKQVTWLSSASLWEETTQMHVHWKEWIAVDQSCITLPYSQLASEIASFSGTCQRVKIVSCVEIQGSSSHTIVGRIIQWPLGVWLAIHFVPWDLFP